MSAVNGLRRDIAAVRIRSRTVLKDRSPRHIISPDNYGIIRSMQEIKDGISVSVYPACVDIQKLLFILIVIVEVRVHPAVGFSCVQP